MLRGRTRRRSAAAPVSAGWHDAGEIEHVFTHFSLTLRVFRAEGAMEAEWTPREGLGALPSVFLKSPARGWVAPGHVPQITDCP